MFVQTSMHEGFCLPPLEAMATGGAVVCTDAHGNRDFCRDGENCLMPEPTAEVGAAARSRRLLADPELRARLGRGGDRAPRSDYAWERRIDALEALSCDAGRRRPGYRSSAIRGASRLKHPAARARTRRRRSRGDEQSRAARRWRCGASGACRVDEGVARLLEDRRQRVESRTLASAVRRATASSGR